MHCSTGSKAMIVVAGGSSARFGDDKMMAMIAGKPLVVHTLEAVASVVDRCVLVCRSDQIEALGRLALDADLVPGGSTRTTSEMAGLAALGGRADLIGIHDGARPLVPVRLIETLFEVAARTGGAVPVLDPDAPVISRKTLRLVDGVGVVQTPQVFAGGALTAAYVQAAQADYEGQDTADVVMSFSDIEIAAVAGDPGNVKVTYPGDVEAVRSRIEARSHIGPA
ncbi:MAG: 2-C-methyl-D-erythritol 4-phosphate cytidylyltransferase [Acidobacteria bacterium]|nr:2-C-methyl-D-erythritol 4-phosphate cytidylyltransferase [Acidobacteriota bacterium]